MDQPAQHGDTDRFAVIDVGSNSVKLSIAVAGERRPTIIETGRIVAQLGSGMTDEGKLNDESMQRTADAVAELASEARAQEVQVIRAVATSAAREASNSGKLKKMVKESSGLELEIISGDREAELIFTAVSGHHLVHEQGSIVFDTGGGSTEIVIADQKKISGCWSTPLGALRLAHQFQATGRVKRRQIEEIRSHVALVIQEQGIEAGETDLIIGTGGTCTALALMDIGPLPIVRKSKPPSILRENHTISRDKVEELLAMVRRMGPEERRSEIGLQARRAEIIVAGICIVAELMQVFQKDWLTLMDVGLRDGLLREIMTQA
ncbi:MAG: hypothetical protein MK089_04565 [Phycisphaerales bacterium]|nr:hypothetical protein [Phycisphaerales bacterium]